MPSSPDRDVEHRLDDVFSEVRNQLLLAGVIGVALAGVLLLGLGGLLVFLITARGVGLVPTSVGVLITFALCAALPLHRLFGARRGEPEPRAYGHRNPLLLLFAIVLAPVLLRRNLAILLQAVRARTAPHSLQLAGRILAEAAEPVPVHALAAEADSPAQLEGTLFLLRETRLVRVNEDAGTLVRTLKGERLLQSA